MENNKLKEAMEEKGLKTKVFEALGEVSMCWSETPKGVFDSTNAERIGNELMKEIENEVQFYKKAAEDLWQLLDNIDTSTDIFKPTIDRPNSLMAFYNQTNKYTAKRFDILKSDGYKLYTPGEFNNLPKQEIEWKAIKD